MKTKIKLPETELEFKNALYTISELTAKSVLKELGLLKPYLSLNEAYSKYGEGTVDRWVKERLVRKIKDGEGNSPVRIDRIEIEAVAQTSNRAEWYISQYGNEIIKNGEL
jgi:hypothetical protein